MSCGSGIVKMAFDATNSEAIAWAEREAASLVVDITTEARLAIREAVTLLGRV